MASKKLTAKQTKALAEIKKALLGEQTIQQALLNAGYSEETARQQKSVIDSLRSNSEMQQALEDAGIDESFIADKLGKGLKAESLDTMFKFLKLASELKDAFPAKKNINADVPLDEILGDVEPEYAPWSEPEED